MYSDAAGAGALERTEDNAGLSMARLHRIMDDCRADSWQSWHLGSWGRAAGSGLVSRQTGRQAGRE